MTNILRLSPTIDAVIKGHLTPYAYLIVFAALITFVSHVYEARHTSFILPTTDTKITIRYGDLLSEQTDWIIGVNEFFDDEIGDVVSAKSLHGKFISKIYNGNVARFRDDVDTALLNTVSNETGRGFKPNRRFEIGTTAVLRNGSHKVFLVAMSRTDLQTAKASSDVPTLWVSLRRALQKVCDAGNGQPLSLPLMGNGQSSVNVQPQHLLRLITLALVDFGRTSGLPKTVNIILNEACFDLLDIHEIKRDWSTR